MAATRTRSGCQNCRIRHLKCDDVQSTCARCQAAGIECVRGGNIRFKHISSAGDISSQPESQYRWQKSQIWPRTSTSDDLIFIDETESVGRSYEGDPQLDEVGKIASTTQADSPRSTQLASANANHTTPSPISPSNPTYIPFISSPTKRRRLTDVTGSSDGLFTKSPAFSEPIFHTLSPNVHHQGHDTSYEVELPPDGTPCAAAEDTASESLGLLKINSLPGSIGSDGLPSAAQTPFYLESTIWPLDTIEKAQLIRYFVDHLAVRFDLCDPARHFATVVPQQASVCPPLLYAIFAVSARHLNKLSHHDPYAADRYHQKALDYLQTMMYDEATVMDENILAATIILRFLEEVDVPLVGIDLESHLVGTKALINAQESSISSPDNYHQTSTISHTLRQACFWIALRQEIYVAFVSLRGVHWNLSRCQIDRSLGTPADDFTWSNRIIVQCAEVLQFCFGDDYGSGSSDHHQVNGPRSAAVRWKELYDYCEEWMTSVPDSFRPIYYRASSPAELIPQIWHIGDAHVTGIQHYVLAMILLSVHNPSIPQLGPGVKAARASMDRKLQDYVLQLSGLGVCNSQTPANLVPACMGITMLGERFVDRKLQEALMSVLLKTEREAAWPTKATQRSLKEAWGWEMDSDDADSL